MPNPRALPKTYAVKSFGCQMNVYDGERMAELLSHQGMTAAADGEAAELIVLNTCHIRERADREGLFGHRPDREDGAHAAGHEPQAR